MPGSVATGSAHWGPDDWRLVELLAEHRLGDPSWMHADVQPLLLPAHKGSGKARTETEAFDLASDASDGHNQVVESDTVEGHLVGRHTSRCTWGEVEHWQLDGIGSSASSMRPVPQTGHAPLARPSVCLPLPLAAAAGFQVRRSYSKPNTSNSSEARTGR